MLAHEIIHSIDEVATKFDQDIQEKYWTNETIRHFNSKMKCLIEAYRGEDIEINGKEIDGKIDGRSTLDENLADLMGLMVTYKAYKKVNPTSWTATSEYPDSLKHFSSDQMFFLSYANVHCSSDAGQAQADLALGVESPRKYKVNVPLKHMDQFAQAFQCRTGSKMNPAKKCSIE